MAEETYIVRFKLPETGVQPVRAATAEIVGDYPILLQEDGTVSALFATEVVESWFCEPNSR